MTSMIAGDVARMAAWKVHGIAPEAIYTLSYKAPKDRVGVFLLLGDEAKDGSETLDVEKRLNELGWFRQPVSAPPVEGWRPIGEDHPAPPHDQPVLLYSPPSTGLPAGKIEARPFSTGRSGPGWSEYSQHSWATHWMPLPTPPDSQGGEDA